MLISLPECKAFLTGRSFHTMRGDKLFRNISNRLQVAQNSMKERRLLLGALAAREVLCSNNLFCRFIFAINT
jgi:hypothetical protein